MFKREKLIGNFYMITMMTLTVSIITYLTGKTEHFFSFWGYSFITAVPFAIFYSSFIGKVIMLSNKLLSMSKNTNTKQ